MPNTYVNKVTANGQTLIDLTADTAIASDVAQGKYFHLATGERVAGTASGGGGDAYTLTTVVPQQTFTAQESTNNSYQANLTFTAGLEDGEGYLVTFDGEQYLCECGIMWGTDYMTGAMPLFWGDHGNTPYTFGLDYVPSTNEFDVATYDLNQHTIKVEHLEFVDGPLNLIAKSVTANGTYNASSDNADGYSSVTVNVAGADNTFVINVSYNRQTGMWEPDCTYAEVAAAYQAGKELVAAGPTIDDMVAADCIWDADQSVFYYMVYFLSSSTHWDCRVYSLSSYGVDLAWDDSISAPTGNLSITQNGNNIDVAQYATVSVNVPSGSSMNVQVAQSTTRVANTAYTKTASLTCSTTGTYDVYWDCFRSSTSGTNGSQLYVGGSAYGTANTTFSQQAQNNHLTGVQISAGQEVAVYVRSRATNYYAYCGQLTIVQTA